MQCTYYYGGTFVGGDLDRRWISAPVADLSAFAGHSVYIKINSPLPTRPCLRPFVSTRLMGFAAWVVHGFGKPKPMPRNDSTNIALKQRGRQD